MSWKSIVSAGLLCVLASPVLAAPTLRVTNGPALNAQGDWVWNVSIEPGSTTPVAAELGFDANRTVVSATKGAEFTGANTINPGEQIFTWETLTGAPPAPEGLQIEPIANDGTVNQVFSALGSITQAGFSGDTAYLTIVTEGPTAANLTATLQVLGNHGDAEDEGRIAEATGPAVEDVLNFRGFVGTATRTVIGGDANLSDGVLGSQAAVTGADLATLAANFGKPGVFTWSQGDFNGSTGGSNEISGADLALLASNFGKTNIAGSTSNLDVDGILDPPPGAGGGSAIPEPASLALVGLALLGGLGLFRRKR